jgi:hypothetical protein
MPRPLREQYPTEHLTHDFDFTEKLPDGDSINSAVQPTMEIDAGLTAGNAIISGGLVLIRLGGGILGQSYYCAATVTTMAGDRLKIAFTLTVTDKIVAVRRKYPIEGKTFDFDFTSKIPANDAIDGMVLPTMEIGAGLTASAGVVSGSTVLVRLSAGTLGQSYYCAATVSTILGDRLKLAFMLEISNNAN